MDKIRFRCASCQRKMSVKPEIGGKRVRCPDCGSSQTAPTVSTDEHPAEQQKELRYDAFISYCHAEPDQEWGLWLQSALESYRTPKSLVRERNIIPRLKRVFRNEDDSSSALRPETVSALADSKFLIVVCSPRTPKSQRINREVQRFREMGRGDQVLSLLIEGEPVESFPWALQEIRRDVVREDQSEGEQKKDPRAVDVRGFGEKPRQVRQRARFGILAPILGVELNELRQRDQQRRRQKRLMTVVGSTLLVAMLGLVGFQFYRTAEAERLATQRVLETEAKRQLNEQLQREQARARQQARDNAQAAWDRAKGVDPAQGFEKLLAAAATELQVADKFLQEQDHEKAVGACQSVIAKCQAIDRLDSQRRDAIQARTRAIGAREEAGTFKAADSPIASKALEDASQLFESGDFNGARRRWLDGATVYEEVINVPVRSAAEIAWAKVKDVDGGQGLSAKLSEASSLRRNADDFIGRRDFALAIEAYRNVSKVCSEVERLDATRRQSRDALATWTQSADKAKQAGLDKTAADQWARAQSLSARAQSAFDAGSFEAAETHWREAVTVCMSTKSELEQTQIRAAKEQYEKALKSHDVARLNKFGGSDWLEAQRAAKSAAQPTASASQAVAAYAEALARLESAARTASSEAVKAEQLRVQQEISTHLANARNLLKQDKLLEAFGEVRNAFTLDPNDAATTEVHKMLLARDPDWKIRLGIAITEFTLKDVPLKEGIDAIRKKSGLNVSVAWQQIERAGLTGAKVSINLKSCTVRQVLDTLCKSGLSDKLDYECSGDTILISTVNDFANRIMTRNYPVGDVVRTQEDMNDLVRTLTKTIDAPSWRENGGQIGEIRRAGNTLTIMQNRYNHAKIDDALAARRQSNH